MPHRYRIIAALLLLIFLFPFPPEARAGKKISLTGGEKALLEELAAIFAVLGASRTLEIYDRKGPFDSILPVVKLEASYQKPLIDGQGFHLGGELGMAFLGGDIDYTRYLQSAPSSGFHILSIHGLFRMALIREAQLNVALGYKKFFGGLQNNSVDAGFPLTLFPGKHWSIEAKPFFSFINNGDSVVYDLSGSLRYKYKLIGIKGGYRWVHIQGQTWQGPEAGLVFEW